MPLNNVIDMTEPDRLGLPKTEDYRVIMWEDGESKVYFSYTKQGLAISMHIAADKAGKRHLREAVEEFVQCIFALYGWCEMVIGVVGKQSIVNLAKKCGFDEVARETKDGQDITVVMRAR